MQLLRSSFDKSILVGLILCTVTSCRDESHESPVPAGRVHYSCSLVNVNIVMQQGFPQPSLETPGGYVRCYDPSKRKANEDWGKGGLLLVHGFDDVHFYAYDLTCPNCYATHASSGSRLYQLQIASDQITAICPECESEFGSVFWGSPAPTKGPANESNYILRQYRASLAGDQLVVTN